MMSEASVRSDAALESLVAEFRVRQLVAVWDGNGPGDAQGVFSRRFQYTADAPASPLLAAGGAVSPAPGTAALTEDALQPLLREAVRRWGQTGLTAPEQQQLASVSVQITDPGGATLGLASGNSIWLDDNAAGWGWFVDHTPSNDSEFRRPGNQGEQGKMDLLSVLMHEMGHLLRHDHDEHGVMQETLAPGTRVLPERHAIGTPTRVPPPAWDTVALALALDAELRRKR